MGETQVINQAAGMKILVTGGTGFIGTQLVGALKKEHHEVMVLSRYSRGVSDRSVKVLQTLHEIDEPVDAVINLAGAPIHKRWSQAYKKTLLESRVTLTRDLVQWMKEQTQQPRVFISGSAIGFYGASDASPLDEASQAQSSFTHTLCSEWESAALDTGIRTCLLRLGVVLGKGGGVLKKMLPSFKLGFGGRIGSGQQYFSWIHIRDVCRAIRFLMRHTHLRGVFNLTAPSPVTNKEFTQTLAAAVNRPAFFVMPEPIIALLFGEMGNNLLLQGQNVVPKRLQETGFDFHYPDLNSALQQILDKNG